MDFNSQNKQQLKESRRMVNYNRYFPMDRRKLATL
jgi:hypothetical protein